MVPVRTAEVELLLLHMLDIDIPQTGVVQKN